jgi:hypothetical protein
MPIVALTAHALPEDQASFLADGMVATLTKPLSKEGLQQVLHGAVPADVVAPKAESTPRSEAYTKLLTRFVAETDSFVAWSQTSSLPLSDVAEQAHKTAGSAAVFQVPDFAEHLITLATAARADDGVRVMAALKTLPASWKIARERLMSQNAL